MNTEIESIIRQAAQFAAASLVTYGAIDGSTQTVVASAIASVAIAVWGIVRARQSRKLASATKAVAIEAVQSPQAVAPWDAPVVVANAVKEKLANGNH